MTIRPSSNKRFFHTDIKNREKKNIKLSLLLLERVLYYKY